MIHNFEDLLRTNSLEDIVCEIFKEMPSHKQDWIIQRLAPRWSDKLLNSNVCMYIKDHQFIFERYESRRSTGNYCIDDYYKATIYKCKFCKYPNIETREYHECSIKQKVLANCCDMQQFVNECKKFNINFDIGILNGNS